MITLNIYKPINSELFNYIKSKYISKFHKVQFIYGSERVIAYCSILGSHHKPNNQFDKIDPIENAVIRIQKLYRLKSIIK